MAPSHETKPRGDTEEMQHFLGWAYWLVGGLAFYWETSVFATVNRPTTTIELPLLGQCSAGEALLYTLTFFWPVLLALHLLVWAHQSVARKGNFTAQFPGVLSDKVIPRQLGYLRVLLFVVLVAWPTGLHVFHTFRTFDHMSIVLKVESQVHPGTERAGWRLLTYSQKPVDGEWRWLHWRDVGGPAQVSAGGTLQPLPIMVPPPAIPVLQPWFFVLAGLSFTAALVVELARAFRRRKP